MPFKGNTITLKLVYVCMCVVCAWIPLTLFYYFISRIILTHKKMCAVCRESKTQKCPKHNECLSFELARKCSTIILFSLGYLHECGKYSAFLSQWQQCFWRLSRINHFLFAFQLLFLIRHFICFISLTRIFPSPIFSSKTLRQKRSCRRNQTYKRWNVRLPCAAMCTDNFTIWWNCFG